MRAFSPDLRNPANNRSINSVGNESLLPRLEESRQGALHFLLVGGVELLGSSDDTDDLATVRGHQGAKGGHHGLGEAQPVILGECFQQVLAQVGNLEALANSSNTVKLQVVFNGGVEEEGAKARVSVHGGRNAFRVLLHGFQGSVLVGG